MKKIIALICTFAVIFSLAAIAKATVSPENTVYANNVAIDECGVDGDAFRISYHISRNTGIMGYAIVFTYDSNVLTPVKVNAGMPEFSGMLNDSIDTSTDNTFKVVYTGSSAYAGDGEIFSVTFRVKNNKNLDTEIGMSFIPQDTFDEKWRDVTLNCCDTQLTTDSSGKPSVSYNDAAESEGTTPTFETASNTTETNPDITHTDPVTNPDESSNPVPDTDIPTTVPHTDIKPDKFYIANYSDYNGKTLGYKTTITFSFAGPDCKNIKWNVEGADFTVNSDGSCTVNKAISGFTVYVTADDCSTGEHLISDIETIKINTGFFAKLIAFFRGLFGKLPVIYQ